MLASQVPYVGKQFKVGLRRQKTWGADMAISFFFGEFGAGLFLVSLFANYMPGLVAGLLITTVGKTVGHLLHLGRPERAWRAISMVKHSWLSRGLLSIILYASCGGLYIINHYLNLLPPGLAGILAMIAGAAAIIIMMYQGLIMSHSASITLWASGLMPVIGMVYALLSGVTAILVFGHSSLFVEHPELLLVFKVMQALLLLLAIVAVWGLLHAAHYGSLGGRESVERLLKQDLSRVFVGGVLVVGFGLTALLIAMASSSFIVTLAIMITQLTGFICFRLMVLKAANYDPIMLFNRVR